MSSIQKEFQTKTELWWRFADEEQNIYSFDLYIAYPDGSMEGFDGRSKNWTKVYFKRDNLLCLTKSCVWEFISELD